MLSVTAGVLGFFAHKLLRDREIKTFELQYDASVVQLAESMRTGFVAKASAAETAALMFTWPPGGKAVHTNVQQIADLLLKISGGRAVAAAPIIYPSMRDVRGPDKRLRPCASLLSMS